MATDKQYETTRESITDGNQANAPVDLTADPAAVDEHGNT